MQPVESDEEDDDIDALIDELQSNHNLDEEDEEDDVKVAAGEARPVPEELLQTDPSYGLTSDEVTKRRKRYGLNQMAEESESLIVKFLGFFIGPIQFVMEAAAILAAGLEDWVDFGVILGLLFLNAAVGLRLYKTLKGIFRLAFFFHFL